MQYSGLMSEIIGDITHHPVDATKGAIVTSGAVAPGVEPYVYGEWLATHGFWMLSLTEWIQVVGVLYILKLLGVFRFIKWGYFKLVKLWRQ